MGSVPQNRIWNNVDTHNTPKQRKPQCPNTDCNSTDVELVDVTSPVGWEFEGGTLPHWSCRDCLKQFTGRSQEQINELASSFSIYGQRCLEQKDASQWRWDHDFKEAVSAIVFEDNSHKMVDEGSYVIDKVALETKIVELEVKLEELKTETEARMADAMSGIREQVTQFQLDVGN